MNSTDSSEGSPMNHMEGPNIETEKMLPSVVGGYDTTCRITLHLEDEGAYVYSTRRHTCTVQTSRSRSIQWVFVKTNEQMLHII